MKTYKVLFRNPENDVYMAFVVRAPGIIPAIEEAIKKAMLLGWDVFSAQEVLQ